MLREAKSSERKNNIKSAVLKGTSSRTEGTKTGNENQVEKRGIGKRSGGRQGGGGGRTIQNLQVWKETTGKGKYR